MKTSAPAKAMSATATFPRNENSTKTTETPIPKCSHCSLRGTFLAFSCIHASTVAQPAYGSSPKIRSVERAAGLFLATYDLTPTQFNALMIVRDYEKQGIKQSELARRLLINRASTGTLIDNLVKRKLLVRMSVAGDRRAYHLALTRQARQLLKRIRKPYYARVSEVLSAFSAREKRAAAKFLERFRDRLRATEAGLQD